jgi:signal transduction histidine kinase
MDNLEQLREKLRTYLFLGILLASAATLASYWGVQQVAPELPELAMLAIGLTAGFVLSTLVAFRFTDLALVPLRTLRQTILSQADQAAQPPNLESLKIGRELVTSLAAQVMQLASVADKAAIEQKQQAGNLQHDFIGQNMPLPLFVLDSTETILFANGAAAQYIGIEVKDMVGKNVYMVLDMSFPNNDTFDSWLKGVKSKSATAASVWERVRLNVRDNHPSRLFDLAAYYNRDNPNHHETMLILFDHTKTYSQDEQAVSFIALSVHELRTPLTLLRGYIEVFEEELSTSQDPQLIDFMQKMRAMAEQLTAFVNNILNVARVEDDQLELRLQSEDWAATLKASVELISLRAKVRGITIKCRIHQPLPAVGIDRLSIREVINNLIDNAIKYSGNSKLIQLETFVNKEGMVETTVQDFGLGIPNNVLPNLFTKFYRDHNNRAQIGGTGLGLYLSKAIVSAHGGNIWARSQEGQGSTFGFTLLPYDKLAEEKKQTGDQDITRGAHGWIKNHSLYRR